MYKVSTVQNSDDSPVSVTEVGTYSSKIKAMTAAKKLAKGAKDCQTYGPRSLAYYGEDITAVVAW